MIKGTLRTSELNSFTSVRAIRGQAFLSRSFGSVVITKRLCREGDFSALNSLDPRSSLVIKPSLAGMTKFPLSMPYGVKAVKNKEDFTRRYGEIFKGEANAAQCFKGAEPHKESDRQYEHLLSV